jgi:peptidoglycan/LPS O-acetylase OafA/YrhL
MFMLAILWASEVWTWNLLDIFGYVQLDNYNIINAPFLILIVVLTSDTCKMILETKFMRFMGKISFMMYLIHPLIVEGFMSDFYLYLIWNKFEPKIANLISFLALTPVLIGFSYFLTIFVDIPAKDFAFNLDMYFRNNRPEKDDIDYYSCNQFWRRSPKILMIMVWLILVGIVSCIIPFDNTLPEERCIDEWLYP